MSENDIVRGSGNVFADLGLPDAEVHRIKARVVAAISNVIRERRLSSEKAAELAGIPADKLELYLRGRFSEIGMEHLLVALNGLGVSISIDLGATSDWSPSETTVGGLKRPEESTTPSPGA